MDVLNGSQENVSSQSLTNSAHKLPQYKNIFTSQFSYNNGTGETDQRQQDLYFDTTSMTGGYVGKSKLSRAKSQGHQRKMKAVYSNNAVNPEI